MYAVFFCLFSQPQAQQDDETQTEMDEAENEGNSQLIEDIDNDVAVERVVKSTKEPTRMGKQSKKR